MSGFFVSNNLGTFSAEGKTPKVFNAVTLTGFPDGVTSMSGRNMRGQLRTASAPNQYLYSGTAGNKKGSGWAHQYENNWLTNTDNTFFNRWTNNDQAVMRDDEDSMQYFRPAKNVKMKVKIGFYDCTLGDTNYNYTTYELGIPSEYVTKTGHREVVEVWLDGNSEDYIFIDFDDDLSANTFDVPVAKDNKGATYAVVIKSRQGTWQSHHDPDADHCSTVYIQPIEAVYTKEGCTDTEATNYDPMAGVNTGCSYTRATPSLTLNKTEVREGEPVKISWVLDNSGSKGYSKIQLWDGTTKIKESTSKSSYYNYTPTGVGNHPIFIKVLWDHGSLPDTQSQILSVVDAVSFQPCAAADIHRNVDGNGECADCKPAYSMIDDDGYCTNCAATNDDPYRAMNNDGTCGDCLSGYAEHTDGTCKKVGCMTFTDGTSASGDADLGAIHTGDYNYDSDAEINDSSLCENPDGVANGGGNGGTPDVDCELSDWSDWSEWSTAGATDGVGVGPCGTRTRTRTVITDSGGNGAVCGALEETETKDCSTGEVTTSTDDITSVTPTTKPSPVIPIILGVAGIGVLALLMRR
jgi:hypothetical protein